MAHLTNFSFEFCYKIFTEDASLPLLYNGAKKSKMIKNSNQGGPALTSWPKLGEKRGLRPVEMALSVDHRSSYFLLTSSIFLHPQFSLSLWWLPGQNVGPGEERDSGNSECKGLNSPDPVRKAGGFDFYWPNYIKGSPSFLFFFLEIPALMHHPLVCPLFHVAVVIPKLFAKKILFWKLVFLWVDLAIL